MLIRRQVWLPVVPIAAGLMFLVSDACGILTAPVTVPAAIAQNHNAQLEGTITDEQGQLLHDVTLSVQKSHVWWDAVQGERVENETSETSVSETFSVWRRSSGPIRLIFSKQGYLPTQISFDDKSLYLSDSEGAPPKAVDGSGKELHAVVPLAGKVRVILYPAPHGAGPGQ